MLRISALLSVLLLLAPGLVRAADVPVAGHSLRLKARAAQPERNRLRVVMRDAAVAAPFADPTAGARLVVSGGAGAGQCFADVALDPAHWRPIGGDGATRGWRYMAPIGAPGGVRRVVVRPGRIDVMARGAAWPCDVSSPQRLPVSVRLHLDGDRYCAAFGDDVRHNLAGRLVARATPAPTACSEKDDVTLANLNILHGLGCAPDFCRFADRVALFYQWVADAGCPDVVTLQEIFVANVAEFDAGLAGTCPFVYESAHLLDNTVDDVLFLSRYPIVQTEVEELHLGLRNVAHARIDHPIGPVDVFSTHLAASIDFGNDPCGPGCPAECTAAGAITVRDCQAVQAARFVESRHDLSTPAFVTGDFNAEPGTFPYLQATSRGWIDTFLAAGNPAVCDVGTGAGCGSDRASSLAALESPAAPADERIDYIFLIPPTAGSCSLDTPADADGDGTATAHWADAPNPFAPSCGPAPLPICWPSDHDGNQSDLNCS